MTLEFVNIFILYKILNSLVYLFSTLSYFLCFLYLLRFMFAIDVCSNPYCFYQYMFYFQAKVRQTSKTVRAQKHYFIHWVLRVKTVQQLLAFHSVKTTSKKSGLVWFYSFNFEIEPIFRFKQIRDYRSTD